MYVLRINMGDKRLLDDVVLALQKEHGFSDASIALLEDKGFENSIRIKFNHEGWISRSFIIVLVNTSDASRTRGNFNKYLYQSLQHSIHT